MEENRASLVRYQKNASFGHQAGALVCKRMTAVQRSMITYYLFCFNVCKCLKSTIIRGWSLSKMFALPDLRFYNSILLHYMDYLPAFTLLQGAALLYMRLIYRYYYACKTD
jgi:hypothetical protein